MNCSTQLEYSVHLCASSPISLTYSSCTWSRKVLQLLIFSGPCRPFHMEKSCSSSVSQHLSQYLSDSSTVLQSHPPVVNSSVYEVSCTELCCAPSPSARVPSSCQPGSHPRYTSPVPANPKHTPWEHFHTNGFNGYRLHQSDVGTT